jgi:hypothetical protein
MFKDLRMRCGDRVRPRFVLASLGLAIWCASPPAVPAQQLMRWKFQPGQQFDVQVTQRMEMEATLLDRPIRSVSETTMHLEWAVQAVDQAGTADVRQTFRRVKMTMDMPGVPAVEYDSASPDKPTGMARSLADQVGPMIGAAFEQSMTTRGEVLSVTPTAETLAQLEKTDGDGPAPAGISEESLKGLLNQTAAALPEHAVKPGDTWQGQAVTQSPVGALKMDVTYTFAGQEERDGRPLEKIDVEVKLSIEPGEDPATIKVAVVEQESKGVMLFDAQAGRFVETNMHQKMTLATTVGDQEMRQKVAHATRMTVIPSAADAAQPPAKAAPPDDPAGK